MCGRALVCAPGCFHLFPPPILQYLQMTLLPDHRLLSREPSLLELLLSALPMLPVRFAVQPGCYGGPPSPSLSHWTPSTRPKKMTPKMTGPKKGNCGPLVSFVCVPGRTCRPGI